MDKLLEETVTRVIMHEKYFDKTAKCFAGVITNFRSINRKLHKTDLLLASMCIYMLTSSLSKNYEINVLRKEIEDLKGSAEVEENKE